MLFTRVKYIIRKRHTVNLFLFLVLGVRNIITTCSDLKKKNDYDIISIQIKHIKFLNFYIPSFIYLRFKLLDCQYQSSYFTIQFNETYNPAPAKTLDFAKSKYCLEKFLRTALAGDWLVMRSLLMRKRSTKFHVLTGTQKHDSSVRALKNHSRYYSMATVINQPYSKPCINETQCNSLQPTLIRSITINFLSLNTNFLNRIVYITTFTFD
jgi:hypothetical protein